MRNIIPQTANTFFRFANSLGGLLILGFMNLSVSYSIPILDLKSTSNFIILAGSTVTGLSPFNIKGDVGLSPAAGSNITGFDGSNVDGTLYVVDASGPAGSVINSVLLQTAKSDLTTAYNDAAGRTPVPTGTFLNPGSGNLGGLNLVPGLYKFTSDCQITGSDLTLTGNATDVWIFQIATSLNLGSGIKITLSGGAQASNIFWQVGSSATLGTYSTFQGSILADQSISLSTGASMDGRALAFTGAVTMQSGVVTKRSDPKFPIFSSSKYTLSFGNVGNGTTKKDSIIVTNTGKADLIISNVLASNTLFTITPTTLTIKPDSSVKYFITFAPLTDGSKNGNFIFTHNAEKPKDTIIVSGSGVSPIFTATPTNLNFGNVRTGTTKRDSIVVSNPGTSDLVISSITISNNSYSITPNNSIINAGGSTKYYITFAPLTVGVKNGNIIFTHNADKPKDTIIVTGNGVSPIFSINNSLVDFGDVRNGTNKMDSVIVTNIGTSDLAITNITTTNTLFSINPNNAVIPAGMNKMFYITFAPLTDGDKTGNIIFTHNADKSKDTILVIGTGVSPKFSVTPINLNFGNVLNGTSKKDSVVVTNVGTSVLTISNVVANDFQFTSNPISGSIMPGMSKVFVISFAPQSDGLKNATMYFNHDADNLKDSISMNGVGISPKFVINPRSINFGEVNTSLTKKDSIIITNTGSSTLLVFNITSTNTHYVVTESGATIEPGETHKFYILFTPLFAATHNGFIKFSFNGAKTMDSISVTGKGVGDPTAPIFALNPKNYDLGSVQCGEKNTKTISITNIGTANLTILGVSSSNVFYSVTPAIAVIAPGVMKDFVITFAPLTGGIQIGKIYFYHNSSNTVDSINVSGMGLGDCLGPIFSVKTIIDFGNVNLGESKQKSIIVSNTGSSDLIIRNVQSSNNQYTIVPILSTIVAGEEKEIFITYTPNIIGQTDAVLTFSHNAGENKIYVTGVGIKTLNLITIDAAKKLPVGTEFIVEGIVTRTLGNYTRFQDDTAGLTILQTSGDFYEAVENLSIQNGDKINIQGKITEVNHLKVIQGIDLIEYKRISRNNTTPMPIEVNLVEIKNNGEVYESRLIKLVRLTIAEVGDETYVANKNYQVVDNSDNSNSVIIHIGSNENTYISGRPFFSENMTFEGILGQLSDINPNMGYELTPILPTDLMPMATGIETNEELTLTTNLENYPNPFSNSTSIQYNLEKPSKVSMKIVDLFGNEIKTLVYENQVAGLHTIEFNLTDNLDNLANGTYINILEIDVKTIISKMQIIK
jgi:uncharacterized protein YdeI (BOF family)